MITRLLLNQVIDQNPLSSRAMSSPQRGGWAWFHIKNEPDASSTSLPRLLVKMDLDNRGPDTKYELLLSDSSRVWREALTNEQIIARARDIHCAIEPLDTENRQAVFDLIKKSFSDPGQRSGEVKLEFSAIDDGREFILRMSAPLAPGLPDLTWEVHLKLLPPSAIFTYLLDPLLVHASDLHVQVGLLIKELEAKDHVLERVCDRLEASGDSLTAVFPAKAGVRLNRNKSQRLQLGPHVHGLGKFDSATWPERWQKAVHESDVEGSTRKAEVLQNLSIAAHSQAEDSFWWRRVAQTSREYFNDANVQRGEPLPATDLSERTAEGNIHAVPHRLPPSRRQDQSEEPTQRPARRLGAFGGRSRAAAVENHGPAGDRSRTASPVAESRSVVEPRRLGAIGGRRPAPERGTEVTAETPQPSITTTNESSLPARKARLGTIGGRSRNTVQDAPPECTITDPPAAEEPLNVTTSQSNIRVEEADDDSTRGRQISEAPNSCARDETSQERADRKRQELKRELEDGVSTGTASKNVGVVKKKKRKF
jgi:hypothetical protein